MIAYNKTELEKFAILDESRGLFKSGVLSKEQWEAIQTEYTNPLYSPSLIMKVFLFLITLLALTALMGPLVLIFQGAGLDGIRGIVVFYGIVLITFTEIQLIATKKHFKTGATEAGLFAGFSFISFGILGIENLNVWVMLILGSVITWFISRRYLNWVALVLNIGFVTVLSFRFLHDFMPFTRSFLPFIFMGLFGCYYLLSKWRKGTIKHYYFNNHIIIAQTMALLCLYFSVNYFVVRELSVNLLGLNISANGNIPGAYIFYFFTAAIPIFYFYWGVRKKSILFIRVALLCLALSISTLKYYFSLGMPVVTITIAGALLIASALFINNYLKQIRNGFTREKLLNDKWGTSNLMPFIASQTLGGSPTNVATDTSEFGGGAFGGGGASSDF
jgi:hypothetical protein